MELFLHIPVLIVQMECNDIDIIISRADKVQCRIKVVEIPSDQSGCNTIRFHRRFQVTVDQRRVGIRIIQTGWNCHPGRRLILR